MLSFGLKLTVELSEHLKYKHFIAFLFKRDDWLFMRVFHKLIENCIFACKYTYIAAYRCSYLFLLLT